MRFACLVRFDAVHKGDVLVELDPEPFRVQVAIKQSVVDVANANLEATSTGFTPRSFATPDPEASPGKSGTGASHSRGCRGVFTLSRPTRIWLTIMA